MKMIIYNKISKYKKNQRKLENNHWYQMLLVKMETINK